MRYTLLISPLTAVLGSCALSGFFVVSLYVWKLAGYKEISRDETGTIQRRFVSASLSCFGSVALIWSLAEPAQEREDGQTMAELLGLQSHELLRACAQCLALTVILFAGPIVQHWVSVWEGESHLVSRTPGGAWVALRNYVIAPLYEEFVFRACLVRLWVAAGFPKPMIIFCCPFWFAMAHAHHFIEHVRRLKSKTEALKQIAFQVFYTSLFGMYSNFLLLRTGCTVAVILTHSFCNHQGFPDISFLVMEHDVLYQHRVWLGVLYLTGVVAFCCSIAPLSEGFSSTYA